MIKKIFKVIGTVFLVLMILLVLLTAGLFISDRVQHSSEKKMLTDEGFLNLVPVGEYSLNVCSYGSDDPKHTIVGISGMGVSNYSAAMRNVTDRFADENRIVFVDRAGYGLSDDTKVPQTTERVVEDYRNALKNAGYEAPYLLMPHSLGGIYSSYWVSKYPEEIEAIIYLDCTQCLDNEETFEDAGVGFEDHMFALLSKLGWQRPAWKLVDPGSLAEAPDGMEKINKALLLWNGYSYAMLSEEKYENKNCYDSYLNTVKTDVPKLYICSNSAIFGRDDFYEMVDLMNAFAEKAGSKKFDYPSEEAIDETLEGVEEFRNSVVIPYVESLGNCELKYLNGTHMLYTHRPDDVADIAEEFIEKLNKTGDLK